ncbi:MAG: FtsX-like permease family protein, partial [Acidimicrobiales bacterium]
EPTEAVISLALARRDGLGVGDTFELFPEEYLHFDDSPEAEAFAADLLASVPDLRMRVVGVYLAPAQVPPLPEIGLPLMQLSPALSDVLPLDSSVLLIDLADGATAGHLRVALSDQARQAGATGDLQLVDLVEVGEDVARSLRPQVVGLRLLAAALLIAALVVAAQTMARLAADDELERAALSALGFRRLDLVASAGLRALVVAGLAGVVAVVTAVALSALGASGIAHTIDPDRGIRVDGATLAIGVGLCVLSLVGAGALLALRRVRSTGRTTRARGGPPVGGPLGLLGWRAAFGGADRPGRAPLWSAVSGVGFSVVAVTAALTVGASLDRQLDDPSRSGLRWDARIVQFEDDTVAREGPAVLVRDDDVDGLAIGMLERAHVDASETTVAAMDPLHGDVRPPLVRGVYPDGPDTVALGARTLRRLGVALDETITLAVEELGGVEASFRVVGEVVVPAEGFGGRLDEGFLLSLDGLERLEPRDVPIALFVSTREPGDLDGVVARLADALETDEHPSVVAPVAPGDIVDLEQARAIPRAIAAILAVIAVAALVHALAVSARERRGETALVRALGLQRGQVTAVALLQALILSAVALAVGVPLGVASGRAAWDAIASSIGSQEPPAVPVVAVVVAVPLGVAAIAALTALATSRRAASSAPAGALRVE